jgi:capsular exopolysaccharide synthesis family protein
MGVVPGTNEPLTFNKAGFPNTFSQRLTYWMRKDKPPTDSLSTTRLAVQLQENYIKVQKEDERGATMRITVNSTVPGEAALIANLYAEEYVNRTLETSRGRIVASRRFLEEQLETRKMELQDLETRIQEYMSREGAVGLDGASNLILQQVVTLETERDKARTEKQLAEIALRSMQDEFDQIRPQIATHVASRYDKEIEERQTEIARLKKIVEDMYAYRPELRQQGDDVEGLADLRSRIGAQEDRVRQLSQQYANELNTSGASTTGGVAYMAQLKQNIERQRIAITTADARIATLEQNIQAARRRLESIPAHSLQLAQLERGRQSAEKLYISLVNNLEEVRIAEESEIGTARVIRPAFAPEAPVRPSKASNMIMGVILGLMLGMLAAVVRFKMDARIYTPDDLRGRNIPVLGVIPDSRRIQKMGQGEASANPTGQLLDPRSATSEAYRRLYARVAGLSTNGIQGAYLITSPEASVGKSTTALNLALTTALAGQRTLVIDADLYQPTLHRYLGRTSAVDLGELLINRGRLDVKQLETGIPNLYALTTHQPVKNAAELLGSKHMRALMGWLRGAFDVIVIDSPPILHKTDATLLSAQCDATVLVVSAGKTDFKALKHVVEELKGAGGQVVGTVLNRFDPERAHGYKQTYAYGYDNAYGNAYGA